MSAKTLVPWGEFIDVSVLPGLLVSLVAWGGGLVIGAAAADVVPSQMLLIVGMLVVVEVGWILMLVW